MTFKKLFMAAAVGLAFAGGAHAAATLAQAVVPGENIFSDDNAELVLKWDATLNGGAGGYRAFSVGVDTVGVKDIFVGLVGITSFPTGALGDGSNLYNQVTAVYAVEALTIAAANPVSCGAPFLTSCSDYTFGAATSASATDPLNGAIGLLNSILGFTLNTFSNTTAKSFGSVQEDTVNTVFDRTAGTLEDDFDDASDGAQRFVFDLDSANGDYFVTTAPANVAEFGFLTGQAKGGSFGGKGTVSYQNVPGWNFGPNVSITGNLYKPGVGAAAPIWSDSTYGLSAERVPEPATLSLVGLALAGLGFASRKRKSQA